MDLWHPQSPFLQGRIPWKSCPLPSSLVAPNPYPDDPRFSADCRYSSYRSLPQSSIFFTPESGLPQRLRSRTPRPTDGTIPVSSGFGGLPNRQLLWLLHQLVSRDTLLLNMEVPHSHHKKQKPHKQKPSQVSCKETVTAFNQTRVSTPVKTDTVCLFFGKFLHIPAGKNSFSSGN